jgi:HSP20 family protein
MTALLPRLFGDVSGWFDTEFPVRLADLPARLAHVVPVEDSLSEQEYVLRAEMPGLNPEKDIQLTVTDRLLTLRAERTAEERTANRSEFHYGVLQRVVRLPANADEKKITATYAKGILEVTVPLTAPEPVGRQIPVDSVD